MTFSLLLDIVVAFLLAGTIYFVWKLSEQMARFRSSRAEMERLIRDLNMAVTQAQQSILALRGAADTSGQELQKIMRGATELSDELQIMTESANSMAARLERAAGAGPMTDKREGAAPSPRRAEEPLSFPGFSIRDPEFDGTAEPDRTPANWDGEDADTRSEAEKELARAIEKNKKSPRPVL